MKFVWIALAIGTIVLIARMRKGETITTDPSEQTPPTPPGETLPPPPHPSKSAKVAFLENLDRFKALLPTLCDGSFNSSDWTDNIIDIDNDELTMYWKKAHTSVDAWMRLLASWGLKPENCVSFIAMEVHKKMYVTIDGAEITLGQSYNVSQKCWIQTDSDNCSKVLVMGKVRINHGNDKLI